MLYVRTEIQKSQSDEVIKGDTLEPVQTRTQKSRHFTRIMFLNGVTCLHPEVTQSGTLRNETCHGSCVTSEMFTTKPKDNSVRVRPQIGVGVPKDGRPLTPS